MSLNSTQQLREPGLTPASKVRLTYLGHRRAGMIAASCRRKAGADPKVPDTQPAISLPSTPIRS